MKVSGQRSLRGDAKTAFPRLSQTLTRSTHVIRSRASAADLRRLSCIKSELLLRFHCEQTNQPIGRMSYWLIRVEADLKTFFFSPFFWGIQVHLLVPRYGSQATVDN